MKYSLVAHSLLTVVFFVTSTEGTEARKPKGLSAVIVTEKDKSGTPTIDRHGKFSVVFTNQSDKPIHLWSEDCQQGYETLSCRVDDGNGIPSFMHRRNPSPQNWRNHPPKTITIRPGEAFAWEVCLSAIWGELVWKDAPEPNTGKMITLTAVLQIKLSDAARKHEVWTGIVTSEPIKTRIVDPKLRTPHEYLWAHCPKQALRILQADPTWTTKRDDMEHTPLHLAARFGFMEVARWLLTHGADVNARAYNQFTPLLYTGHPEIVKLLLEHKADVNAKNSSGRTALEEAASGYAHLARAPDAASEREQARTITKMLLAAGAEYDLRSASYLDDIERARVLIAGITRVRDKEAMRWAATFGRTKIVKLLLQHGADLEDADCGGLTISYFALEHADVLKLLFEAGADPRVRVEYNGSGGPGPQGSTLLHEAVGKGSIESVKLLMAQGLDVNLADSSGYTPLHVAYGQVAMADWLLRNHADPRARTKQGLTPMSLAASQVWPDNEEDNARYQAVIRRLEKAGVEMYVFAAIACDDIQRVSRILQKNPKAGEIRDSGRPALHRAVTLDRKEIVKLLLDKVADPDIRSREYGVGHTDETALLQAAFWGRLEAAKMLIEHGASVNAKSAGGVVPLHEAARMGHVELARLLLTHGADVNAKDKDGKTPLDWARSYRELPEMTKLLRDHGGVR